MINYNCRTKDFVYKRDYELKISHFLNIHFDNVAFIAFVIK